MNAVDIFCSGRPGFEFNDIISIQETFFNDLILPYRGVFLPAPGVWVK